MGDSPSMVITFLPATCAIRCSTGARRRAVYVHSAGATERDAAAVLRPGEPDRIAQHPQERCIGRDIDLVDFAIDSKRDHGGTSERQEIAFAETFFVILQLRK